MPQRSGSAEDTAKISYQGEPGANSHLAAREAFPDLEAVAYPTFEDAIAAVKNGEARYAMIPIENSVAGRVADIHHLLPDANLYIVAEHFLRVRHQLMAQARRQPRDDQTRDEPYAGARPVPRYAAQARYRAGAGSRHGGLGAPRRREQRSDDGRDRLAACRRDLRFADSEIRHGRRDAQHDALRRALPRIQTTPNPATGRSSPPSSSASATFRRRSTKRWAVSRRTASI